MIGAVYPKLDTFEHLPPITLQIGEVEGYDFMPSAIQIFTILSILEACHLIKENPYDLIDEVLLVIKNLLRDIDLGLDGLQISECKHLRVEFRDEMLSLEVYIGV